MRINLDEPVPDHAEPIVETLRAETEEEEEPPAENSDEIIIRRDLPSQRRKKAVPKTMTPRQQHALAALLITVIVVAVASLGVHLYRISHRPIRISSVQTAQTQSARAGTSRVQQTTHRQHRRVIRRNVPAKPPVYQGPPPTNNGPLEESAAGDTATPTEGIH